MTAEEAIEILEADRTSIRGVICKDDVYSKWSENDKKACKLAISALEKQVPKKRIQELRASENDYYDCPSCGGYLFSEYKQKYCHHCGQKICWSDNE